jgi:hypothetical protein
MVRKTQIKKKKSKSQLLKTLKHYSKTNKKGGGWRKKPKIVPEMPYIQNPFSAKYGKIRFNPGYIPNNNNTQYNPLNNNNLLGKGFGVEETIYNDNGLYNNYNNKKSSLRRSSNEYINVGSNNSQNLSSGVSNGSNGYIYLGSQTYTNPNNNPDYTPMNPIYTNIGVPGEAKLRRNLNNGNLLKGTTNA